MYYNDLKSYPLLVNLTLIKIGLLMILLAVGGSVFSQSDILQIETGSGFSIIRGESDSDSLLYLQGTSPSYLDWDGERFAEGPGNDIFFSVANQNGDLLWSEVYGGGGIERISSSPILQKDADLWLFHGEAIDSLNIYKVRYRPTVSSFFSFIGIQNRKGRSLKVFPVESQGPLEISTAHWMPGENIFFIAGRSEAPILHDSDTILDGPMEPYGFILKMDTSFQVLSSKILVGEVRPFDLYIGDGNIYFGANVRDRIEFENNEVKARVQDFDCLLLAWDKDTDQLMWFHLLGGVYDKNGVRIVPGWSVGHVLVTGDFVGVIGDGEGRSYESNGFDPDLFFWEFSSVGEPVTGLATGSPGAENLVDAKMAGGGLDILIEFSEAAYIFNQEFSAREDGRHVGIFRVNENETAEIDKIFLGAPTTIGFDLCSWDGQSGMVGGFSEKLLDQDGQVLLEKRGTGQYNYFIWPVKKTSNTSTGKALEFKVYPNPFHCQFTIEMGLSGKFPLEYRILNLNGQVVKTGEILRDGTTVDLSGLMSQGALLLEIKSNRVTVYSRLIFNLGN